LARSLTRLGFSVATVSCLIDQASKLYLLKVYGLAEHSLRLGPFVDFVLTPNKGISYGLFQTESALGQWVLLAVKSVAVALLWLWLTRAQSRLTAVALGLIIGGAIGNAVDRLAYGWVADFVFFHVSAGSWHFNWYVFNLADVAIVAGVIGLLYESLIGGTPQKRPDPQR